MLRFILFLLSFQSSVALADVQVLDQAGRSRGFFANILADKRAVVNFVYTNCEGSCPTMGRRFQALQKNLGEDLGKEVVLVSITLDPERDSPEALDTWSREWDRSNHWTLVTGSRTDLDKISQEIFGAPLLGRDMHSPFLVVRNRAGRWVRMPGLSSLKEIREVLDFMP